LGLKYLNAKKDLPILSFGTSQERKFLVKKTKEADTYPAPTFSSLVKALVDHGNWLFVLNGILAYHIPHLELMLHYIVVKINGFYISNLRMISTHSFPLLLHKSQESKSYSETG
jgi:hypothetical protein